MAPVWSARAIPDEETGLLSASPHQAPWRWVWALKLMVALLVGLGLGCVASWLAAAADGSSGLQLEHAPSPQYPLNFLVFGDWGRQGQYNQTEVAKQMGTVGQELASEFVISVGDNFYSSGLQGVDDPQFDESFKNIYTAPSLQTTWYTILGNHDYRGDTLAQLDEALVKRDPRWFCKREYQLQRSLCPHPTTADGVCDSGVDMFFIDTNPFVDEYFSPPPDVTYDWRGLLPRDHQLKKQLQDLDRALNSSSAAWKFVFGHHPIRSVGVHGDTRELIAQVLPILEANGVDAYINGHDHTLQHIKRADSPVHFITSGGGSKAYAGIDGPNESNGLAFAFDGQGFISVSMAPSVCHIVYHDAFGSILYNLDLKK